MQIMILFLVLDSCPWSWVCPSVCESEAIFLFGAPPWASNAPSNVITRREATSSDENKTDCQQRVSNRMGAQLNTRQRRHPQRTPFIAPPLYACLNTSYNGSTPTMTTASHADLLPLGGVLGKEKRGLGPERVSSRPSSVLPSLHFPSSWSLAWSGSGGLEWAGGTGPGLAKEGEADGRKEGTFLKRQELGKAKEKNKQWSCPIIYVTCMYMISICIW